jgi:hypothetical protein
VPGFDDLLISLSEWLFGAIYVPPFQKLPAVLVIGCFAGIACMAAIVRMTLGSFSDATAERRAAIVTGFALAAAPLLFFAVSRIASPIFMPRYMAPSAIGIALLAAVGLDLGQFAKGRRALVACCAVLLLPLAAAAIARPHSLDVARIERIRSGRPLVCDWLQDFMIVRLTTPQPAAIEYPMDWQAALHGPASATGAYRIMENYQREGYLAGNAMDEPMVLAQPLFLVLDDTDTNWFSLTIEHNPRFVWRTVAQIDGTHRILEVHQAQ